MKNTYELLADYNGIIKECNKLYRNIAKTLGLADSTFWILYTLRENDSVSTQRDLINANLLPPQTINSALKKMESQGLVELSSDNDKRKKQVCLTSKGQQLASQTTDKVFALELETMDSFPARERDLLLDLLRKHTDLLKTNLSKLDEENTIE